MKIWLQSATRENLYPGTGNSSSPLIKGGGGGEAKMKHYMNVHLGNVGGKERREGVL